MPSIIVFLSFAVLMTELSLIQVFDILVYPQMSYLVIALAFLGFSFSGFFLLFTNRLRSIRQFNISLVIFVLSLCLFYFLVKNVHIDLFDATKEGSSQILLWAAMVASAVVPFICLGYLILNVLVENSTYQNKLYALDFIGAGVATLLFPLAMQKFGADTLILFCALSGGIILAIINKNRGARSAAILLALLPILLLTFYAKVSFFSLVPKWMSKEHFARENKSIWDGFGRVDIIGNESDPVIEVFYNGGSIGTHVYKFDGDYQKLRVLASTHPEEVFTRVATLASHQLLEGSQPSVFQIGVGAGQEVKAALTFGASKVVGIDINPTIIDLMKHQLSSYSGGLYQDPRVLVLQGDGRRLLNLQNRAFDIIQIFSSFSQSNFIHGKGLLESNFLLTKESMLEYFRHLNSGGILHINHSWPKRVAHTAAVAWREFGGENFYQHLVIVEDILKRDTLATVLIKMRPWTEAEIEKLRKLYALSTRFTYEVTHNPTNNDATSVWSDLFAGRFNEGYKNGYVIDVSATTDDKPFIGNWFNFNYNNNTAFYNLLPEIDRLNFDALRNSDLFGLLKLRWRIVFPLLLFFIICVFLFFDKQKVSLSSVREAAFFALSGVGFIGLQYYFLFTLVHVLDSPIASTSIIVGTFMLLYAVGGRVLINYVNQKAYFIAAAFIFASYYYFYPALVNIIFMVPSEFARILYSILIMAPVVILIGPVFMSLFAQLTRSKQIYLWILSGITTSIGGFYVLYLFITSGFQYSFLIISAIYMSILTLRLRHASSAPKAPSC